MIARCMAIVYTPWSLWSNPEIEQAMKEKIMLGAGRVALNRHGRKTCKTLPEEYHPHPNLATEHALPVASSWPHRLARPTTSGFHPGNRGSNPLGVTPTFSPQFVPAGAPPNHPQSLSTRIHPLFFRGCFVGHPTPSASRRSPG